MAFIFTFFAQH